MEQQQKNYRPDLGQTLAIATGPVQFLAASGHPLDEGKWTDPIAMLQHAADIGAAAISVLAPGGMPIHFDATGQALTEVQGETHRCKFNTASSLPLCPLATSRCHSPCDLMAQSPGRPQLAIRVSTPDGDYPAMEARRPARETRDLAGKEVITRTEFISRTYRGETVVVNGGYGPQEIRRLEDGYYTVDGEGHHSLYGLLEWLGSYHAEFGEAVFWPG